CGGAENSKSLLPGSERRRSTSPKKLRVLCAAAVDLKTRSMPERLPPKPATTAGQFDLFGKRGVAQGPRVYTVSELTREIKGVLEGRFPSVFVKGEVSNVWASGAGHVYFTLKDEGATLDAVLFRTEARRLKFQVKNGQSLVARGHLDLYEPKGEYKLICDTVEPLGAGALQVAF